MSLEFLSAEQVASFGRFTGVPSRAELDRCCVLSDTDLERAGGDGVRRIASGSPCSW